MPMVILTLHPGNQSCLQTWPKVPWREEGWQPALRMRTVLQLHHILLDYKISGDSEQAILLP